MSSTLRSNTQDFASTASAVVYTATTTLSSATAIVSHGELVTKDNNATALRQPSEVATFVSESSSLVSIVTPASTLIKLIPALRDFARAKTPVAVHVPITSATDITNVLAVRDSGAAVIRSSQAQQAVDFALAASLVAKKLSIPVIHVFDAADNVSVNVYEAQEAFAEFVKPVKVEEGEEQEIKSYAETVYETVAAAMALTGEYSPITYAGAENASLVYVTFGSAGAAALQSDVGAVQINLYRPINNKALLAAVPASATKLVALEQAVQQPTPWGPLLFDLASLLYSAVWDDARARPVLVDGVSAVAPISLSSEQITQITSHVAQFDSPAHFSPAELLSIETEQAEEAAAQQASGLSVDEQQKRVERIPYGQLLRDIFKQRLNVANAVESSSIWGDAGKVETNPEFGFGQLASYERERERLATAVTTLLRTVDAPLSKDLHAALTQWLSGRTSSSVATVEAAEQIVKLLAAEQTVHAQIADVYKLSKYFAQKSNWLIGADEWSYDVGSSGVHHVIASGLNVNMLVLDTATYPFTAESKGTQRKKDIGLYAMNYGTAYVASVAVYSSYTQ
ncbi:Sulfite reductase [NADPH] subunit beta, partial [Linderina macrospora]